MQNAFDPHLLFEFLSGGAVLASTIVGLMIRAALSDIKITQVNNRAELVEHQLEIKEELNRKHAENTQSIAVHEAEDTQKFEAISRTLTRIDTKLDKITNGVVK